MIPSPQSLLRPDAIGRFGRKQLQDDAEVSAVVCLVPHHSDEGRVGA
jgi:hypothetical protein